MNITYVVQSLSTHGGIEKIVTLKANYLASQNDYNISIITYDQGKKPIFFKLDEKIKIFDIAVGLPKHSNNMIKRKFNFYQYRKLFLDKIANLVSILNPDIIISVGGTEFFIIHSLNDKSIKLAEYHVTIAYFQYYQQKEQNKLKTLFLKTNLKNFLRNVKKYEEFIVLTEGDKKAWGQYSKNISKIPNFLTMDLYEQSSLDKHVAIAVGRFEIEKQFDHLILAWKEITKKYPNWLLKLKGSGSQEKSYRSLVKKLNLENNVEIIPPSESMKEFYLEASIYLMSSKFEGFSLVILEALQAGLPVISYDCRYGPSELIEDGFNGFLVEQDNIDELVNKIINLIEDKDLRKKMGDNALLISKNYEKDKVMEQWMNLFNFKVRNRLKY